MSDSREAYVKWRQDRGIRISDDPIPATELWDAAWQAAQAQAGVSKPGKHVSKPMTIELVKYIGRNGAYAVKQEVMYKARRIGADGSTTDLMGFMSEGFGYISRKYAHQDAWREHQATGWPIVEVDLTGGGE